MKKGDEVNPHIEALGQWAMADRNRVAFVICGEVTHDDSGSVNLNLARVLVGDRTRVATALYGVAGEDGEFKRVLLRTVGEMIKDASRD